MKLQEELYDNIPPSLKVKEVKPFIKAEKNKFWLFFADLIFESMLKKKFAAIRVKNLENLNRKNLDKPTIIYAPHICWWDGILAYYLNRKVLKLDTIGMMEDLHAIPFLRKMGAFSVDKKSPKVIKESLNFVIHNLDSPEKALFIYPQGIIRPQDYPNLKFSSGISYIASNLDGVNLIPLAIRYCFLRATSPEILIDISEPIFLQKIKNKKEITKNLQENFVNILEKQRLEIANCDLDGYITVLKQKENLFDFIQKKQVNIKNLLFSKKCPFFCYNWLKYIAKD